MGSALDSPSEQTLEGIDRLYDAYPDLEISLNFSTRLELLIAVILSAQCTDERVNKVTADLFEKYDGAADYANAEQEELAEDLNSVTYYNNKASYIRSACQTIIDDHDGEVPDTMDELTELSGSAEKPPTSSSSTVMRSSRASLSTPTSSDSPGDSGSPRRNALKRSSRN